MQFFNNCQTIDEVKSLYKKLAKEFHPDHGGKTATMQAINSEYAFATAKILKGENFSSEEISEQIELSEKYRQAIEAIIHLPDINIEVVGNWIWVSGNTYPHRSKVRGGTGILPDAGYLFAAKKAVWYFRSEAFKTKSYRQQSLDEIRAKYGSTTINNKFSQKALR